MFRRSDPAFLAVSRGEAEADLLVANARVVNVFTRCIEAGSIVVHGGRVAAIVRPGDDARAREVVDAGGRLAIPGLIDAHVHIESMMLPPSACANLVVAHGTTGLVADPHEIGNVAGIPGIRWMMEDAHRAPIRIWFTASSCVPASPLETAAARLTSDDLAPLFDDSRVIALAEMMNFPGTIAGDPEIMAKIALGLARRGRVDGHAPGLRGRRLQTYIAAGPSSDHESFTADEAAEKLALGQRVFIREGSAARNLEALLPLVTQANAHRICFCTDDVHAFEAAEDGHLDRVVRRAAQHGLDGPTAIAMASLHVAEHFGLHDHGAIAPGMAADFSLARSPRGDFSDLAIDATWVGGQLMAERGTCVAPATTIGVPPFLERTIRLPAEIAARAFLTPARVGVAARVIGIVPGQIITANLREVPRVVDGFAAADTARDLLLLASIESHGRSGGVGAGLVRGFGLREGAIASTVGHDAHNLSVAGVSPDDMLFAAKRLEAIGGGQCVVANGQVLAELPLPIAGLLSDRPAAEVGARQHAMQRAYESLGGTLKDPFMQLAFLPLSVIPHLKLSDQGIVDVDAFRIVPLQDH
jgi:adenine deaminase